MSVVKSFSVGEGDMFYIRHGSDNFTVIDCCNYDEGRNANTELFIDHLDEIKKMIKDDDITRFISTHPDDDHISGLCDYDDIIGITNFYCVENNATKEKTSFDFIKYCFLRDDDKAFFLEKGCSRRWLNKKSYKRHSSGICCLWPITTNKYYKEALEKAENGESPNNISPILVYSTNGIKFMWMGDIEEDFLEKVKYNIDFQEVTILFAPHHGRDSGKIPEDVLRVLNPKIIIIGEAPSEDLNYYSGYNTITQNSAGDIAFESDEYGVHIYVGNRKYSVDYLTDYELNNNYGCYYIGTLEV